MENKFEDNLKKIKSQNTKNKFERDKRNNFYPKVIKIETISRPKCLHFFYLHLKMQTFTQLIIMNFVPLRNLNIKSFFEKKLFGFLEKVLFAFLL